jgi:hypothetical protein
MANRAVDHNLAMAAKTQLHSRVDPAAVELAGGTPDSGDYPLVEPDCGWIHLLAERGDRLQIPGDPDPVQRIW